MRELISLVLSISFLICVLTKEVEPQNSGGLSTLKSSMIFLVSVTFSTSSPEEDELQLLVLVIPVDRETSSYLQRQKLNCAELTFIILAGS